MIRRIHLVFKTHLDLGFTDLASNVVDDYMFRHIPKAIRTAEELRSGGLKERMVWTTGSWLIRHYLDNADRRDRGRLEAAIERGDIAWHALPFTTHTELMDAELFRFGLSIARDLDSRFGRTTTAAKMTDVPGHTIAMVPLLAEGNVRFIHIGVNGGSTVPEVPRLFRWVAPDGSEVMVQYDDGYGTGTPIRGLEDLLYIEHGYDNCSPPSAEQVVGIYRRLRARFPYARIMASTLDDYAAAIARNRSRLPVVRQEIGDTWIHGIGSDPFKTAGIRCLLRQKEEWQSLGFLDRKSKGYKDMMNQLLLSTEHTWGLDSKKFLPDYSNWSPRDFQTARGRDLIDRHEIPRRYAFIDAFRGDRGTLTYSFFESSHSEKRSYLDKAVWALPKPLARSAAISLEELVPKELPNLEGTVLSPGCPIELGLWSLEFSDRGAITSLKGAEGRELVLAGESLGLFCHQSFDCDQYRRWHRAYNRNFHSNKAWVLPDFGKPGLEYADPPAEARLCSPRMERLVLCRSDNGHLVRALLRFEGERPFGAPDRTVISYLLHSDGRGLDICLDWLDKRATRMPEALWLSFGLEAGGGGPWRMVKLGTEIKCLDSVPGGAKYIHAVEALRCRGNGAETSITPLDSPLVSLEGRHLLEMERGGASACTGRFHFVLYNNLWGTNFPLWYGDNGRSRFSIRWDR